MLLVFCVCAEVTELCVSANSKETRKVNGVRFSDDGNWVKLGGVNSFAGKQYDTSDEVDKLEKILKKNGYICVYGKNQSISDDEYEEYIGSGTHPFWFDNYMRKDEIFYNMYFEVYVYGRSYIDYKAGMDNGLVEPYTREELNTSTVLLNRAYFYTLSKVGKVIDEVNDKIPVWWSTGYLRITSPINCKITVLHPIENCYYEFNVKKNTPFLVKLKYGGYVITKVNGVDVDMQDEFVPFNNNVQIETTNTEEEPYELDLKKLVENRNIPDVDPDDLKREEEETINLYEDVSAEKTIVDKKASQTKWSMIIMVTFGGLIVLLVAAYFIIRKKINKGE